jgi:hypothetical protein
MYRSPILLAVFVCMLATTAWAGYVGADNALPAPVYDPDDVYYSNYSYDGLDRRIRTDNNISFATRLPPPDPDMWIESFFDVTYRIEFDDGVSPPELWEVPTQAEMRITGLPWDGVSPTRDFEIEILSMELVSPFDMDVILTESPSEVSGWSAQVTDLGGGLYHIDSFFDVYFDLSMHGPAGPWVSPDAPQHIVAVPEPVTLGLMAFGAAALLKRRA